MSDLSIRERKAPGSSRPARLIFLKSDQLDMIDEALASLGDYGEVRLVVEKGRLRFIVTERSYDVTRWEPGITDR